ncbi:MAG: hypothetical protein ACFHU9_08775 [Fluviicola sp.]
MVLLFAISACAVPIRGGKLRKLKVDRSPKEEVLNVKDGRSEVYAVGIELRESVNEDQEFREIHISEPENMNEVHRIVVVQDRIPWVSIEEVVGDNQQETAESRLNESTNSKDQKEKMMKGWQIDLLILLGFLLFAAIIVMSIIYAPSLGLAMVYTFVGLIVLGLAFLLGMLVYFIITGMPMG